VPFLAETFAKWLSVMREWAIQHAEELMKSTPLDELSDILDWLMYTPI
jgi:hypothetical protein